MKKLYSVLFVLSLVCLTQMHAQTLRAGLPQPNGPVWTTLQVDDILYFGGEFDLVGANTPYGAALDLSTGAARLNFVHPNGPVKKVVVDGTGGFFIWGNFSTVGGARRDGLAKINADGTLNPLDIRIDLAPAQTMISDIAADGNRLYVSGTFQTVNGEQRHNLASFDAVSGALLPFAPVVDGPVRGVGAYGGQVFFDGNFRHVNNQLRYSIAAVDGITGVLLPWNAAISSEYDQYFSIKVTSTTVFAGGIYNSPEFPNRPYGIAFDRITAERKTFGVGSGPITRINAGGGIVFVSGDFTRIAGQSRNFALLNENGSFIDWLFDITDVTDMAVVGNSLYLSGGFTEVKGQPRKGLVAFDIPSRTLLPFNPTASDRVNTIASNGDVLYAGGNFLSVGGAPRKNAAAINLQTGMLLPWNPNANGPVYALLYDGYAIYAGGHFTQIGTQHRVGLAQLGFFDGTATLFDAGIDTGRVYSLAMDGTNVKGNIYFGGAFTKVAGQVRWNIASVEGNSGTLNAWEANAVKTDGSAAWVRSLTSYAGNLYFGGNFDAVRKGLNNDMPRMNLAAVSLGTGIVQNWAPMADKAVNSLAVKDNNILAGGRFTTLNGVARNNLGSINASTGELNAWDPMVRDYVGGTNGTEVYSVSAFYNTVFVGGRFSYLGGQRRNLVGAVDAYSAMATPWHPDPSGDPDSNAVYNVKATPTYVFVGGNFTNIDYKPVAYLGVFSYNPYASGFITARPPSKAALEVADASLGITLYPNPVVSDTRLVVRSEKGRSASYSIVTMSGAVVKRSAVSLQPGDNIFKIDMSALPKGSYILMWQDGSGTRSIKFIKP